MTWPGHDFFMARPGHDQVVTFPPSAPPPYVVFTGESEKVAKIASMGFGDSSL